MFGKLALDYVANTAQTPTGGQSFSVRSDRDELIAKSKGGSVQAQQVRLNPAQPRRRTSQALVRSCFDDGHIREQENSLKTVAICFERNAGRQYCSHVT